MKRLKWLGFIPLVLITLSGCNGGGAGTASSDGVDVPPPAPRPVPSPSSGPRILEPIPDPNDDVYWEKAISYARATLVESRWENCVPKAVAYHVARNALSARTIAPRALELALEKMFNAEADGTYCVRE